ncbi:MAG TPA: ATP phosphoribosyltransferase [Paenibacillus sp.]|jgi:ATP phosphoribosyltransferase
MIRIGLPKGVVKSKSVSLIESYVGGKVNADKLHFLVEENIYIYLLKHRDIPMMIDQGILDFGITSSEWIKEGNYDLKMFKELDWCDTRISLLSERNRPVLTKPDSFTCVTEFPNTAMQYFQTIGRNDVNIQHVNGSTEGFVPTIFDCCVDCVETGHTLHLHNLQEENVLHLSKIVVVGRRQADRRVMEEIDRFLERLEMTNEIHSVNGM